MKRGHVFITPLVGISLVVALLWILNQSSAGQPIARAAGFTVCPAGPPLCSFSSIQAAVDAASNGDVIKVATGVYTDVHTRPRRDIEIMGVVTQVVYIDKSLILRGGYTATNFTDPPVPTINTTVLDAQERGRVLYVTSAGNVMIEGFQIIGGDASGLHGSPDGNAGDAGGGGYVISSTIVFRNNHVYSNTAYNVGSGLFVYRSNATFTGNTITNNIVHGHSVQGYFPPPGGWCCKSGALALYNSVSTLTGNTISHNESTGVGGLMVEQGDVMLVDNTISDNHSSFGYGGGVSIVNSDHITVAHNVITENRGIAGLEVLAAQHILVAGNTITGNQHAGLYLVGAPGKVSDNIISDNGGTGVYLHGEAPVIEGNIIVSNTGYTGGGLYLFSVSNTAPTLINNLVAYNRAEFGSGLLIYGSPVQLLQTTLVSNTGGDGNGIYIAATPGGVTLINTILGSQTLGITVSADSSVTLDSILWFNNGANTGGSGFITITHAVTGNPQFALDGYHVMSGSAAIDAGIEANVLADIDNEPRPYQLPDLGADEYWPPGTLQQVYLPLLVRN